MNNVIIACQTLKDELEKAITETECQYPVLWIDADYHVDPDKLRTKLQQEIDQFNHVDNILLVYGSCGNGLIGLVASAGNLIIPKTDDCISLVMTKPNEKFERLKKTYFLTKGWIESPKSIVNEYTYTLNRYGEKRTTKLFELMLKQYDYLMLIDTGAYDVEEYKSIADDFANKVKLQLTIEKGDLWLLKQLLIGPYDEKFCVISKGEKVTLDSFR